MADKPILVEIKGLEEVDGRLHDLAAGCKNLRPAMRAIAAHAKDAVAENFEKQGRPKWAEWSDKYKNWREKHGRGDTILTLSAQLRNSVTARSDDRSAVVGTNKVYAAVHQLGINKSVAVKAHSRRTKSLDIHEVTKRGSLKKVASGVAFVKAHSRHMKMPPRPFLHLEDSDKAIILKEVTDRLRTAISKK